MKKLLSVLLACVLLALALSLGSCGAKKEKILIYTSAEDFRVDLLRSMLKEKFPQYDVTIEYMSTGDHAAKLIAEGTATACDITYDLEYGYLTVLEKANGLADLSGIADFSLYPEEIVHGTHYLPEVRNGGAVIVNTELLAEKGLPEPASYEDLLKPEYKSLVSMANPKSSGTGYMFLLNLVNARGEEAAFSYFDKLSENILAFTSSGSGPVNALLQKEAAVGLGMTSQAVQKINTNNAPFKILFFPEGSPYSMYGQAIIRGKETREAVVEVFRYISTEVSRQMCEQFYPELIFKDTDYTKKIKNFPQGIVYGDMKNSTPEEKERLLAKWTH